MQLKLIDCVNQYLRLVVFDLSTDFKLVSLYSDSQEFAEFKSKSVVIKFFPGLITRYQINFTTQNGNNADVWVLEVMYKVNNKTKRELIFPGSEHIYPKNENNQIEVSKNICPEIFELLLKIEEMINNKIGD